MTLHGASTSIEVKDPIEIISAKKRLRQLQDDKQNALNHGEFEEAESIIAEENVIQSDIASYKRSVSKEEREIKEIGVNEILETVSELVSIPLTKLSSNEKDRIAHIDDTLKQFIVGQDDAVDAVCKVVKRNRVGLGDKSKTLGNFFLLGPSGTRKNPSCKEACI